jgi:hypothetical protein
MGSKQGDNMLTNPMKVKPFNNQAEIEKVLHLAEQEDQATQRPTQIPVQMSHLSGAVDMLEKATMLLLDKLHSVTLPVAIKGETGQPRSAEMVPVAEELCSYASRVRHLAQAIMDTAEGCQL